MKVPLNVTISILLTLAGALGLLVISVLDPVVRWIGDYRFAQVCVAAFAFVLCLFTTVRVILFYLYPPRVRAFIITLSFLMWLVSVVVAGIWAWLPLSRLELIQRHVKLEVTFQDATQATVPISIAGMCAICLLCVVFPRFQEGETANP